MAADLILPAAMWVEKEGAYGNAERRTQFWRQQVNAPGEARSDLWQLMEFSKRFTTEEVWPARDAGGASPHYRGKTLYDVLFAMARSTSIRRASAPADYDNDESKLFGFYVQKGLFEEYAEFGAVMGTTSRRSTPITDARPALAGRRRQGDAVALPRRLRPVREDRRGRATSTASRTARQ